jgi:AcrR family transcriptional regulator
MVRAARRPTGPQRVRRTQAERSRQTRERIVTAATACIADAGFASMTMSGIAERAGVTWGAMQHQFGDKDAIVDAVVDRSLADFVSRMDGLRRAEPDLARRVRAFTERAWQGFKPAYRVILDILLHRRDKTDRIAAAFGDLWVDVFGDQPLSPARQVAARRFTFVMLSGIATEAVVVPGSEPCRGHFAIIERELLAMLAGRDRAGRREGSS